MSSFIQTSICRVVDFIFNTFKNFFKRKTSLEMTKRNEGFFRIKLGEEVITQLSQMFSFPDFIIPPGFSTTVEIPISVGRQLFAAYMEAILRDKEEQDELFEELHKEHEEFEKMLVEEDEFVYSSEVLYDNYLKKVLQITIIILVYRRFRFTLFRYNWKHGCRTYKF